MGAHNSLDRESGDDVLLATCRSLLSFLNSIFPSRFVRHSTRIRSMSETRRLDGPVVSVELVPVYHFFCLIRRLNTLVSMFFLFVQPSSLLQSAGAFPAWSLQALVSGAESFLLICRHKYKPYAPLWIFKPYLVSCLDPTIPSDLIISYINQLKRLISSIYHDGARTYARVALSAQRFGMFISLRSSFFFRNGLPQWSTTKTD